MHPRDRLDAALKRAMDRACAGEMEWGRDDCALWCADVLKDALGYDAAESFRDRYRTKIGSRRVLGSGGLAGALRRAARRHGWTRIAPHRAQVGDIGFAVSTHSVVICRAPGWFVGRSPRGLAAVPVSERAGAVRFAWKVARHKRPRRPERPLAQGPSFHARRGMAPTYEAPRDPLSLSLALSAALGGIPVSVGVVAAFTQTALAVGVSIGLNYAASALLQRGNQPLSGQTGGANDPSVRYNTRQAIPPKRIIYGTAQVGGALFYEQVDRPYLYQGLMLCAKPIARVRKIWIGTNALSFSSLGENSILTPLAVEGQPDYANNLLASVRLGGVDQQLDPLLATGFAGLHGDLIDPAAGTAIGDMTGGGGLAAAFDGDRANTAAASAATTAAAGSGFIGKDYGAGVTKQLRGFRVTAPSNSGGFSTTATDSLRFTLRGSNDGSAWTTLAAIDPAAYAAKSKVQRSLVSPTTAYRYFSVLVENLTSSARVLSVAEVEFFEANGFEFRQRGIATAVLRYNFGADQQAYTDLWGQVQRPDPIFLVDGIAVPDPRRTGCIVEYDPNDPDAVAEAEATWTWSNNAALCQAHYLTQPYGGKIDPRRMNWEKVARAADWDDGLIGTKSGGLIKRGTLDGLITLNQKPSDVISSMLSANRGFVLESAGKVWVSSSEPRTAVATIHDPILSGGIEYQAAKPKRDLINRLKVRFVAPDREYQTVDGPVLSRDDLQAADGELLDGVLDLPFTLDETGDAARPQVLQKAFIETSRLGRRISCVVDVKLLAVAADELVGNTVNFSSDLFPQFDGEYFVEKWGFAGGFGAVELSLIEYRGSIETNFNAANDQQDFVLPPVDIAA